MSKSVCELMGKHTLANCESIGGNLYRFVCPECGVSVVESLQDIKRDIIEALNRKGYKNIQEVSHDGQ